MLKMNGCGASGIAFLLLAGSGTAAAQPVRLALDEAIRRGLETSPRLAELSARRDATRAVVDAREADARPQVAVEAGYLRTNHIDPFGVGQPDGPFRVIFPDIPDNYRTRLGIEWPLLTGGRREALTEAAGAESEAAVRDLDSGIADLRLEIAQAYWALVTAQDTVRVVEGSSDRIQAHRSDVRARLDAGLVPPNDVLVVDAQYARQRALAIEARKERDVAALTLKRLLGLGLEVDLDLVEPLVAPAAPAPAAEGLVEDALRTRADRQALVHRIAGARSRVSLAAAALRPSLALAGSLDYARPNPRILPRRNEWDRSWDLGINVRWPWLDGGRTRAAIAEAAALELAAEHRLEEFDRRLDVEIRRRRLDLDASAAAIEASQEAVTSAAEARRVIGERYGVGVATSTDVLDAEVAVLQAELERTRALAAARLAAAALARAVGE